MKLIKCAVSYFWSDDKYWEKAFSRLSERLDALLADGNPFYFSWGPPFDQHDWIIGDLEDGTAQGIALADKGDYYEVIGLIIHAYVGGTVVHPPSASVLKKFARRLLIEAPVARNDKEAAL